MCLQPYAKKNPNYGLSKVGLNYLKDCENQYISIPCGHCPECIANKQMQIIQRCELEARNSYVYFGTLTYDNAHLPSVTTSSGFDIRFADYHDIQNMFKHLRTALDRPFRYLAVSELGTRRGRPHFHFLLFLPKSDNDTPLTSLKYERFLFDWCKSHFARNIGTRKNPVYEPLFTYVRKFVYGKLRTNYDLHFVTSRNSKSSEEVAWYCVKYMFKPSDRSTRLQQALKLNLDEDEYSAVWNLVRPRYVTSRFFGLQSRRVGVRDYVHNKDIISKLRHDIVTTPSESPFPYYRRDDGSTWPLARSLKKVPEVFTLMDAHEFYFNHALPDVTPRDKFQDLLKFKKHAKNQKIVDSHDNSDLFELLCE